MQAYSLETPIHQSLGIFTNPGSALSQKPDEYMYPLEVVFVELPEKQDDNSLYYCAYHEDSENQWYATEDEAKANSKIVIPYRLETIISAYPEDHVFRVFLSYGSNGELFTRINSHPETDGTKPSGRIFFPDEQWPEARSGWADVQIVKELDTVGYIVGTMVQTKAPEEKEFAIFLRDWFMGPMEHCEIEKLTSEENSSYHIFDKFDFSMYFTIMDGEIKDITQVSEAEVEWRQPLVDFMVHNFYPGREKIVKDLIDSIQIPNSFVQYSPYATMDLLEVDDSKVLNDALHSGLVYGFVRGKLESFAFTKYPTIYCDYSISQLRTVKSEIINRIRRNQAALRQLGGKKKHKATPHKC